MMEPNTIIQGLLGALCAVLWYLYRDTKAKCDGNEKALLEFKVFCAQTYVTNDQLTQAIDNIAKNLTTVSDGIVRIEGRLNNLVDKHHI